MKKRRHLAWFLCLSVVFFVFNEANAERLGIALPASVCLPNLTDTVRSTRIASAEGSSLKVLSLQPEMTFGLIDFNGVQQKKKLSKGYPRVYDFNSKTFVDFPFKKDFGKHIYRVIWCMSLIPPGDDADVERQVELFWKGKGSFSIPGKEFAVDMVVRSVSGQGASLCCSEEKIHYRYIDLLYSGSDIPDIQDVIVDSVTTLEKSPERFNLIILNCAQNNEQITLGRCFWVCAPEGDDSFLFEEREFRCEGYKTFTFRLPYDLILAPAPKKIGKRDESKKTESVVVDRKEKSTSAPAPVVAPVVVKEKRHRASVAAPVEPLAGKRTPAICQSAEEYIENQSELTLLLDDIGCSRNRRNDQYCKEKVLAFSQSFMDQFLPAFRGDQSVSIGRASAVVLDSLWSHVVVPLDNAGVFTYPDVMKFWFKIMMPIADEVYVYSFYLAGELAFNQELHESYKENYKEQLLLCKKLLNQINKRGFLQEANKKWGFFIKEVNSQWRDVDLESFREVYELSTFLYEKEDFHGFLLMLEKLSNVRVGAFKKLVNIAIKNKIKKLFKVCSGEDVILAAGAAKKCCLVAAPDIRMMLECMHMHHHYVEPSTERLFRKLTGFVCCEATNATLVSCTSLSRTLKPAQKKNIKVEEVRWKKLGEDEKARERETSRQQNLSLRDKLSELRSEITACAASQQFMMPETRSLWAYYLGCSWGEVLHPFKCERSGKNHPTQCFVSDADEIMPLFNTFAFNREFLQKNEYGVKTAIYLHQLISWYWQKYLGWPEGKALTSEQSREVSLLLVYHDTLAHPKHLKGLVNIYDHEESWERDRNQHCLKFYEMTRNRMEHLLWKSDPSKVMLVDVMGDIHGIMMHRVPEASPELMHALRRLVENALKHGGNWFKLLKRKELRGYRSVVRHGEKAEIKYQYMRKEDKNRLGVLRCLCSWGGWLFENGLRETLCSDVNKFEDLVANKLNKRVQGLGGKILSWYRRCGVNDYDDLDQLILEFWPVGKSKNYHYFDIVQSDGVKRGASRIHAVSSRDRGLNKKIELKDVSSALEKVIECSARYEPVDISVDDSGRREITCKETDIDSEKSASACLIDTESTEADIASPSMVDAHHEIVDRVTSPVSCRDEDFHDLVPATKPVFQVVDAVDKVACKDEGSPFCCMPYFAHSDLPDNVKQLHKYIYQGNISNRVKDLLASVEQMLRQGTFFSLPHIARQNLAIIDQLLPHLDAEYVVLSGYKVRLQTFRFFEHAYDDQAQNLEYLYARFIKEGGSPIDLLERAQKVRINLSFFELLINKTIEHHLKDLISNNLSSLESDALLQYLQHIHYLDLVQLREVDLGLDKLRVKLYRSSSTLEAACMVDHVYFELLRVRLHLKRLGFVPNTQEQLIH